LFQQGRASLQPVESRLDEQNETHNSHRNSNHQGNLSHKKKLHASQLIGPMSSVMALVIAPENLSYEGRMSSQRNGNDQVVVQRFEQATVGVSSFDGIGELHR